MTIIDLFCGAGGAAMGLHYAFPNASIVGVDIKHQPRYPFDFIRADAIDYPIHDADYVHASPPCQRYLATQLRGTHPDYIPRVIDKLKSLPAHVPWSLENVIQAPISGAVMLCGTMFPPLRVIRHRIFLTSHKIPTPPHIPAREHPIVHTLRRAKSQYGKTDPWRDFVTVVGGGNCPVDAARNAMGISWMSREELKEAVPPAYTEYVGRALWSQQNQSA